MSLPPLPRTIFNTTLYRSLLYLWFSGQPASSTGPTSTALKKWFALGASSHEKAAFDAECKNVATPALDFLGPNNYPLPAWKSFDDDRQNATELSAGIRTRILEDGKALAPDAAVAAADALSAASDPVSVAHDLDRADVARAFVLLLDQMPRNVFRPVASQHVIYTHYDRLARALVHSITGAGALPPHAHLAGLDTRHFGANPARRIWFYMPLEHSEDLRDQAALPALIADMEGRCRAAGDEHGVGFVETLKGFAREHADVLERFGRYVHRNRALGRASTEAEKAFLREGGATFGTAEEAHEGEARS